MLKRRMLREISIESLENKKHSKYPPSNFFIKKVHLKRFKYEDNHFMKLNNPVIYP
jgi:hypothetical protein